MEFGDREYFSIKMELLEEHHGSWMFGHLCYFIQGKQVGNWETITSLRDVLSQMQYMVKDCGKRYDERLCGLGKNDLFFNLNSELYSDHVPEFTRVALPEDFAKFDIRIPVEVFDGWRIYLVDCIEVSRILLRAPNEAMVSEFRTPTGKVDRAFRRAYDEIDILLDLEEERKND